MNSDPGVGTLTQSALPPADSLRLSLITTVFNEAQTIQLLLDSLVAQSRQPDEVVICDGGSRDGTPALIQDYLARHPGALPPVRVLVEPGCNISQGRNRAIAVAQGPIIAATDAGVRLDPRWLERLMAPYTDAHLAVRPLPLGVAGFFLPWVEGVFQIAMAATVLPLPDEIDPQKFLPSSRSVAFLKSAWAKAGGYPEWLDYCEDLLFDFGLNAQQPQNPSAFVFAPDAVVYFRPRTSLMQFWTQYYRYARGDGKADLWRKRHLIRYAIYLLALPLLMVLALDTSHPLRATLAALLLGAGVVAYCFRPWIRLRTLGQDLSWGEWLQAAVWVPILRAAGDGAKMVGYPVGLGWRIRRRHQPELNW